MIFYIFIDRFANVNQVYEKPLLRLHTACTSHFQITAPDVSNFNWWRWFSGDRVAVTTYQPSPASKTNGVQHHSLSEPTMAPNLVLDTS
jgi:hypothetical protein